MGEPLLDELDSPQVLERRGIAAGAVSDQEDVLPRRLELGHHVVRLADLMRSQPLHAARNRSVEGVEELAPPRVDHRDDRAVRVPHRERQQVEARDADHRHAQRARDRLRSRDAHSKPGVEPRPDIHGDGADLVEPDAGLARDELDRRDQRLGVTAIARRLVERDHAFVAADGDSRPDASRSRCRG